MFTPEERTWPGVLARRAGDTVFNAAVTGLGLREEVLTLVETGLQTEPDVVIVGLFLNDAQASRFRRVPDDLAAGSAILRRLRALETGRETAASAEETYRRLSGKAFAFEPRAADAWRTDPAALEALVAAAVEDWGHAFFTEAWDRMRPDLLALRDLAAEHDFRLVVLLFPVRYQVEAEYVDDRPQRLFRSLMNELGIDHLDLLPELRRRFASNRVELTHDHCHLTPAGHAAVADQVLDHIDAP